MKNKKNHGLFRAALIVMIGITSGVNAFYFQISFANAKANPSMAQHAALVALASEQQNDGTLGAAFEIIKPVGVPAIYGESLGVSFDDPEGSIDIMRQYDPNRDPSVISQEVLDRYIRIGILISCEYCCSAKTMIFDNGVSACGCAHAKAMRGLTRYLLEAYPSMTDSDILAELVKWKVLYFPADSAAKALNLVQLGEYDPRTFLINNAK